MPRRSIEYIKFLMIFKNVIIKVISIPNLSSPNTLPLNWLRKNTYWKTINFIVVFLLLINFFSVKFIINYNLHATLLIHTKNNNYNSYSNQ